MYGYERSYKTGRAVTSWLELAGWAMVFLGVVVALGGFAAGDFIGMASGDFRHYGTPFIARIISSLPGILIAEVGLISIMLAQHTVATINIAEMTRELLSIARKQSGVTGNLIGAEQDPVESVRFSESVSDGSEIIDVMLEFNSCAERIRQARKLANGRIVVNFVEGETVHYASLDEAKKYLA
jgi:hypothetical protein